MRRTLVLVAVLLAALLPVVASTLLGPSTRGVRPIGQSIDAGAAAFDRGIALGEVATDERRAAFAEAAGHFAEALSMEATPGIAYNLGNARLRAGDTPGAIAAYLTAERLAPGDARVAANLAEARRLAAAPVAPPPSSPTEWLRGLWSSVGPDARLVLALGSWSLGFAILLWNALAGRSSALRATGTTLVATGASIAATLVVDAAAVRHDDRAVLRTGSVVRKGNGLGFEPAFAEALPAGTECRLRESRPGWQEIELSDGARGWVEDTAIEPDAR